MLKNRKNNLGEFNSKSNEGIFLGYSTIIRAYKNFNGRTLLLKELVHVVFNEFITPLPPSDPIESNTLKPLIKNHGLEDNVEVRGSLPREWRYASQVTPKRKF